MAPTHTTDTHTLGQSECGIVILKESNQINMIQKCTQHHPSANLHRLHVINLLLVGRIHHIHKWPPCNFLFGYVFKKIENITYSILPSTKR